MTPEEVIDRLVARRLEKGWTQEEVAWFMGCSRVNLTNLENRVHGGAGLRRLQQWANALGYDLDLELREREG